MKRTAARFILLIGMAVGGTAAVAGSLEDATAAYSRGDYATALPLLRSLAEEGNPAAQVKLGYMYANGRGVAKDDAGAVQWFRKAAEQGDTTAQNELGFMYREGRGLTEDDTEAVSWFRRSADQGNALAQNNLGYMYEQGRGVAKDDAQAVRWYRKAADQGDAYGEDNLGRSYRDGLGIMQDNAAAADWFRKAAEQGLANAQLNVGVLYEKGIGVPQDYAEAARWYLKAAQQGDVGAQYGLAALYEGGTGIAQDLTEARKWYLQAMANPHTDQASLEAKQRARERLENLSGVTEEAIAYQGGRFVLARSPEGACVVALQGVISRDTTFKFDEVTTKSSELGCSKPWLLLESPGGSLTDGISLGRQVRLRDFRTITRYECASACSMIFMGGTERVLVGSRAAIGLHQASVYSGRGNEHRCFTSPMSDAALDIKRYLRWVIPGEADQVIERVLGTSCDTVYWAQGRRALDLGIATRLEAESVDVFGPKAGKLTQ